MNKLRATRALQNAHFGNAPEASKGLAKRAALAQLLAALLASTGAAASTSPLAGAYSGVGWETSLTGNSNWVPVLSPYPNLFTSVVVTGLDGNPIAPIEPRGSLMWHPDVNGLAPSEAYFRLTFKPNLVLPLRFAAWLAADDWMSLSINSVEVTTYLLDDHQDPATLQPIPQYVDLSNYIPRLFDGRGNPLGLGETTILIHARDGGASGAFERGEQWVFFDAYNVFPNTVAFAAPTHLPEPESLALVVSGLCLAFGARLRPHARNAARTIQKFN